MSYWGHRDERLALSTGLSYQVLTWGENSDHTLLFLHGYLDFAYGWDPVVETSGRDRVNPLGKYHVLAPSLRGHGESDWVGAGSMYYFLDYVADVASLVEQRAKKTLTIIGHSMGGTIAAYYAGTYPERVHKLVLIEGLAVDEDQTGPERLRTSNAMRTDALGRRGTPREPGSRRFASLEEAASRMRHYDPELSEALSLRFAQNGCVQLPSGEYTFRHDPLLAPRTPIGFEVSIAQRFWKNITCPVLYVEGGRSKLKLSAKDREERLAAMPHARSITLADASHMMIRHRPFAIAQIVADFVEGQS